MKSGVLLVADVAQNVPVRQEIPWQYQMGAGFLLVFIGIAVAWLKGAGKLDLSTPIPWLESLAPYIIAGVGLFIIAFAG